MRNSFLFVASVGTLVLVQVATADPLSEFVGARMETFESFAASEKTAGSVVNIIKSQTSVDNSFATFKASGAANELPSLFNYDNTNGNAANQINLGSGNNGGFAGQIGNRGLAVVTEKTASVLTIEFASSWRYFGGFWNSAFDVTTSPAFRTDATIKFFNGANVVTPLSNDLTWTPGTPNYTDNNLGWYGWVMDATDPNKTFNKVEISFSDVIVMDNVRVANSFAAVPEPASCVALAMGGLALLRRRRRA